MDAKKTNLTPELKEIYDRVMNTSSGPKPATPEANPTSVGAPAATTLDVAGSPVPPIVVPADMPAPQQAAPSPVPGAPIAPPPLPQMPTTPLATPPPPAIAMPNLSMGGPPAMPEPLQMPPIPTPAEQALSSTPARQVSEGNTFSFSGTATPPPTTTPPVAGAPGKTDGKKKMKLSLPVIIGLGVVFLIVWIVFWALVFGFIPR